jgi:hypothetical protein
MRKDLRSVMLFCSILFAPFGFLCDLWCIPSYWEPTTLFNSELSVERFILGFALGGIPPVIYKVIFKMRLKKLKGSSYRKQTLVLMVISVISAFLIGWVCMTIVHDSIFTAVLGALVIMFFRRDLVMEMIIGSILFAVLYFIILFAINTAISPGWIARTWNFSFLWGVTFLKIPIEEILWAWSFGLVWAPMYEYARGYTIERFYGNII